LHCAVQEIKVFEMTLEFDPALADQPAHPVTLVLNPNARKLRMDRTTADDPVAHFKALLPLDSEVHLTRDLEELDELMSNWEHGERTLCFYGGDGSIAQGITSLIRHHGEDFPLPPVLPVRAGTINMLCNLTGKRESAQKTFQNWLAKEAYTMRAVPTLRVQVGDEAPRYGFIFAWGIGHRVLSEYYRRTPVPNVMDAAAVATQAFVQALKPFNDDLPLFKRECLNLKVDGALTHMAPLHTLTIGTIERISLGMRPFPPGAVKPGGFHFSANGMPLFKVAAYVPTLLFGIGDQSQLKFGDRLLSGTQASQLEADLTDGFTMDGEMIALPTRTRIKVGAGPVVRFWTRS
jgi:hypothetical protein